MSRTTILQIIAAVIFIAVMFGIHQGAGAFFNWVSDDFGNGFLVGAIFVAVLGLIAYKMDKSAAFGRGQKQSPRDTIDL